MDRQNKKCRCARKSGRKKNNAGTDKKKGENRYASLLAKRNCILKDALEGMIKGKEFAAEEQSTCKMDRQNKKYSCARKSWRWKNSAGTDKEEEKKLAGPLAKTELPAEGCSRRNCKRKKVRSRRRYQMIDNIIINRLYEDYMRCILRLT